MKRAAFAPAAALLTLTPVLALADQGPTLYGRANISLENQTRGSGDDWRLQSNASRFGVEGELDLDVAQLKGVYRAEFEVFFDEGFDEGDGEGDTFSQRDIYGGFEHDSLGLLIAGKFDTPLKNAQGKVDQFDDLGADIGNIMGGENRPSNILRYRTPTFASGLNFNLAIILAEEDCKDEGQTDNGVSSSLVFEADDFYAALAYDQDVASTLLDGGEGEGKVQADTVRAVFRISFADLELGALVQQAEAAAEGDRARDSSYLLSTAYTFDRLKLKAQYGATQTKVNDDRHPLMAIGADYNLAEKSKVFTYYSSVETDEADGEDATFGVGFEHKFSM